MQQIQDPTGSSSILSSLFGYKGEEENLFQFLCTSNSTEKNNVSELRNSKLSQKSPMVTNMMTT